MVRRSIASLPAGRCGRTPLPKSDRRPGNRQPGSTRVSVLGRLVTHPAPAGKRPTGEGCGPASPTRPPPSPAAAGALAKCAAGNDQALHEATAGHRPLEWEACRYCRAAVLPARNTIPHRSLRRYARRGPRPGGSCWPSSWSAPPSAAPCSGCWPTWPTSPPAQTGNPSPGSTPPSPPPAERADHPRPRRAGALNENRLPGHRPPTQNPYVIFQCRDRHRLDIAPHIEDPCLVPRHT